MDRSRTITLFAEVPTARRGPSGILVSALVHVAVIGLGYAYLRQAVRMTDLIANQRYNVRLINVQSPHLQRMRSGGSGGGTPCRWPEPPKASGKRPPILYILSLNARRPTPDARRKIG